MVVLLCLYAAALIASVALCGFKKWLWARIAAVVAPSILSCVILADRAVSLQGAVPSLAAFDDLALGVSLPLAGLGVLALFVARWRWLFWLVMVLNVVAGAAVFYVAVQI